MFLETQKLVDEILQLAMWLELSTKQKEEMSPEQATMIRRRVEGTLTNTQVLLDVGRKVSFPLHVA